MPFVEDFTPYFADFGDAGTLNGAAVRVIFDMPADAMLSSGVIGQQPQAQIATASVPANVEGMPLVIPQGSFTVREHLPDGTGLSVLYLRGAA